MRVFRSKTKLITNIMNYTTKQKKAIELFKEYLNMMVECECKIDYTSYYDLQEIYRDYESDLYNRVEEDENDEYAAKELKIIECISFDDIADYFYIKKNDYFTTSGDFNINNLIVEVTRKCNIKCNHCLRGCAENKNIDFELLKDFVNKIGLNYISSLTIGGGESGCNEALTSQIIGFFAGASGLTYGNSWIVLNGAKKYSFDFIKSLVLFESEAEENEIGATAFSFDNYHTYAMTQQQLRNRDHNYSNLKTYGLNVVKHTNNASYNQPESLIKMGRSTEGRKLEPSSMDDAQIYFTVDGLLFSDCNLSYKEMAKKERSKFFICDTKNITCAEDLQKAFDNYDKNIVS